jgi:CRP-like cAMP-binding protein
MSQQQRIRIKLNFFQNATDITAVAAGETIFREGDPADMMYGICEGTVEIMAGGRTLETLGPGGIFGEMALVDRSPRSATVVARTDCKLVPINEGDFLFRVQHHAMFALYVMQVLADRLRRETHRS